MNTSASRPFASVVFDADSTLSALEGIDWLAQRRAPDVAAEVAAMTDRAMNGELPIEDVYSARIALIRPSRAELDELAAVYLAHIVPGVRELFKALHRAGVHTAVMSGGIRDALLPLASELQLPHERVFAVSLRRDLTDVEPNQPLTTQYGKLQVLEALIHYGQLPTPVAFVGDGSTDAAVRDVAHFIAFTGVVRRPAVVAVAHAEAHSIHDLVPMLLPR